MFNLSLIPTDLTIKIIKLRNQRRLIWAVENLTLYPSYSLNYQEYNIYLEWFKDNSIKHNCTYRANSFSFCNKKTEALLFKIELNNDDDIVLFMLRWS